MVPSNIKKFIAGLLLFLLGRCEHASAQNYLRDNGTFQSVVTGTSPGQCLINIGGQLGGTTCGAVAGPNGSVQFNNSGVFGGDASLTFSPGNALVITPTALTSNSALVITQSTPNGGSVAGPINLNVITVTDGTQTVTGSGDDSFGQIANRTNGFQVNYRVTGGAANHFGINSQMDVTGTNGGTVALNGGIRINSGTTTTGDAWAVIGFVKVGATSTLNQNAVGVECEMLVATGGSVLNRVCMSLNSQGPVAATGIDTAIMTSLGPTNLAPYNGNVPFGNWATFSNSFYGAGAQPIATAGSIFTSDAMTIANFLNFGNVTITGNVINTPSVQITGAGSAVFGLNSVSTSNGVTVECSTCGLVNAFVNANGTAGFDGIQMHDSANGTAIFIGVQEASNTTTIFGQASANWGRVSTNTASSLGLMVGTLTSAPMIFGTNNTYAAQITSGQQVQIGPNKVAPLTGPLLTVTRNTVTPPALGTPTGISGTNQNLLNLVGIDGASADITLQAFGTSINGAVRYFRAKGTAGSPTAVGTGDTLMSNFGYGYYTSGGPAYAASAGFVVAATDNFTSTTTGARIDFYATPSGTTGIVAGASVGAGLMVGTTTDPGAGSLQLNAQIFMPNITTSSAAQNGTVCWTTGTGKFTVDTTVGCLTSVLAAKNITERLTSARALEIVEGLSPFAFRYKNGWGDGGHYEQFGLGAEEVAHVDERLAGRDPAGTLQGVRYQELTAVLAGAIQELNRRMEQRR